MPDVVERLEGEARHQCRVADDDRDPLVPVADVARRGEAFGDRQAGAGMAAIEDVVLALASAREAADAIDLAKGPEPLQAARKQLVRICLVACIPHDPVARRVQEAMQGNRDLDHAQAGAEVAARLRDGGDDGLADLLREDGELRFGQAAEVGGLREPGQDRAGHGSVRSWFEGFAFGRTPVTRECGRV